jgi:hypothetical protein
MKKRPPKKQFTQRYNLTTFSDESLKVLAEKSTSPTMAEEARKILKLRDTP